MYQSYNYYPQQKQYYPQKRECYPQQKTNYPQHHECYPQQQKCYPPQNDCCYQQYPCRPKQHECCEYYQCCQPHHPYPDHEDSAAIIPFATGILPAVLTTIAGGVIGTVSLVGFGNNVPDITINGGLIEFSLLPINFAFSAPRNGVITSIAATFSNTVELSLIGATATIRAELYTAPANSNSFTATGAFVDLSPTLTGIVNIGTISSGINDHLHVPVSKGSRLLMVFSATAVGINLITTIIGSAGAGVSIK